MEERVTTLPAKASGFSGHVCGNPLRFGLKAPSEPQDVLCGVDVSVGHVVAGGAVVCPPRERLFDLRKSTAVATRLRGVLRVYRDNSHPSLFRFGCEDANKSRPACVMRALRKAGSSDALDAQGLVGYQPMPPYQSPGLFVVKGPPLVCDLLVEPGATLTSFTAAIRALLLPGTRTLSPPELLQSLPVVARRCYYLTIRGGKEALQSEVYADRRSVASGFGSIPNVADEDSVPLTARLLDGNGLYLPRNRAMQLDLDVPDVLEVKPSILLRPATIAVGGKLDQPEAVPVPKVWIARCFTGLQPAEERLFEGAIQPPERSLSAGEVGRRKVRVGPAGFLESARLLTIGAGAILGLVDIPAFCESVVVQTAVNFEQRIKSFRLRAVRIKAVFERFLHATTLLTKPDVLNGEKGGVMRLPRQLKQTAPPRGFLWARLPGLSRL